ncbi:DUF2975 domain-containing protein [Alkalihalobacillus sp. CinArs1]|uniref:DUF2975 domain-containing protein n=1 Tax=Alkalihalobacillus sp. CinArs1 TaxID=2995314 RepID=UPI0022DE0332|nr:DUF2975 domain-containing protein [Alkalihalobacillus sp. CinArs1]
MKLGSTNFLRIVVVVIGVAVLALCIFALPAIASEAAEGQTFLYPILIGMYAAAIPFYVALYQALKLLSFIDKEEAFSDSSVKSLRTIKFSAATISVLYMLVMPFFYIVGERDDAPGVIAIGLVITFASLVIAVFAAVLQKLLKSAIEIKSENDLTV